MTHKLRLKLNRRVRGIFSGEFPGLREHIEGLELERLRTFEPGDPVTSFHPYLSDPRTDEPLVVVRQPYRAARALILWDLSRSRFFTTCRQTKHALYTPVITEHIAPSIFAAGSKVGLVAFTDRIEHVSKSVSSSAALRAITENLKPRGTGTDLYRAVEAAIAFNIRPDVTLIFSDFSSQTEYREILNQLRRSSVIWCFVAEDPVEEKRFKTRGEFWVENMETGEVVVANELLPNSTVELLQLAGLPTCRLLTTFSEEERLRKLITFFEELGAKKERR